MKWYIGQPIVAIENHSQGLFKKGDEFIVRGIKGKRCNCNADLLDIGLKSKSNLVGRIVLCGNKCGGEYFKDSIAWIFEFRFAPLDVDISELTEILTKENQLTNE